MKPDLTPKSFEDIIKSLWTCIIPAGVSAIGSVKLDIPINEGIIFALSICIVMLLWKIYHIINNVNQTIECYIELKEKYDILSSQYNAKKLDKNTINTIFIDMNKTIETIAHTNFAKARLSLLNRHKEVFEEWMIKILKW